MRVPQLNHTDMTAFGASSFLLWSPLRLRTNCVWDVMYAKISAIQYTVLMV